MDRWYRKFNCKLNLNMSGVSQVTSLRLGPGWGPRPNTANAWEFKTVLGSWQSVICGHHYCLSVSFEQPGKYL